MHSAAEGTLNRWLADRYLIFLALSESGLSAVVRWGYLFCGDGAISGLGAEAGGFPSSLGLSQSTPVGKEKKSGSVE